MQEERFYAHGKLLLTGEYLVLKGAKALAVPTKRGQILSVSRADEGINWISKNTEGEVWFSVRFSESLEILETTDSEKAGFLKNMLGAASELSGRAIHPVYFETALGFPRDWGLGSSSTLTSLVAQYFEVDPFRLFFKTQSGSGYDIACATSTGPLVYTISGEKPEWTNVHLPEIFNEVFFIHLNQKQKSSPEVKRFLNKSTDKGLVEEISAITAEFLKADTVEKLQQLMRKHEQLVAKATALTPVKERLFPDFDGEIKSLGAWGGDFVMALGNDMERYFKNKGFPTLLRFGEMIL